MTPIQIVSWRDIPAQVKVKTRRVRASRQLSERDGEPDAVAEAVAAELEAGYPHARLDALAPNGGQA